MKILSRKLATFSRKICQTTKILVLENFRLYGNTWITYMYSTAAIPKMLSLIVTYYCNRCRANTFLLPIINKLKIRKLMPPFLSTSCIVVQAAVKVQ